MSFFIISDNGSGTTYEMDATVSQSYVLNGKPTEYAVASGNKVSDHYTKELVSLNYSGVVSDVKFYKAGRSVTSVTEFENGILALRDSGQYFACSFSEGQSLVKNCLFTSLNVSRSPQHGRYAISVTFGITQVEVSDVATVSSEKVPFTSFEDSAEGKKTSSGSVEDLSEAKTASLASTMIEWAFGGK